MKKSCYKCRALMLMGNGSECTLDKEIGFRDTSIFREYYPKEECEKPTTIKEYIRLYNNK